MVVKQIPYLDDRKKYKFIVIDGKTKYICYYSPLESTGRFIVADETGEDISEKLSMLKFHTLCLECQHNLRLQ